MVLKKSEIDERTKSPTSIMPKGLLDKLTREEILDLVAYVAARGDAKSPLFQGGRPRRTRTPTAGPLSQARGSERPRAPEQGRRAPSPEAATVAHLAPPPAAIYDGRSSLLNQASGPDAGARSMPPQQKTILLVDDDNEIIESMRTVLEAKGYRVMVARDGNAGLTVAERENPDLIVLDMMMPKKSGFLVLEKLKGRPGGLIPTIMITGNEGSRHRAYAEMLGVRDYIRKPFAMEKLVKSVEQILEGKTAAVDD